MSHDRTDLDFCADDALSGFRLHRLEVFNWGTFDAPGLDAASRRARTACSPATSARANPRWWMPSPPCWCRPTASPTTRPPGADSKERTLRSYVLGHYKSERNESPAVGQAGGAARSQQLLGDPRRVPQRRLRPDGDPGPGVLDQGQRRPAGTVLSWCAERALSIASGLRPLRLRHRQLRKKLRGRRAWRCSTAFPGTVPGFRRRFGIENDQALELFHQTVSMKSVGNLTDFVRNHMLEPFDVARASTR